MKKTQTCWTRSTVLAAAAILGASGAALAQSDVCATATVVTAGSSTPGSNATATSDIAESSCSFNDLTDVWYSFTAGPTGGAHVIDTEGSSTLTDTTLSIYDACGGIELQCDDDSGTGFLSRLLVTLAPNQNIKIRVAGYDAALGDFLLNVGTALTAPGNDTCGAAFTVSAPGTIAGNNSGATSDLPNTSCAATPTDDLDVWFKFVAPAFPNGTAQIDTEGSTGLLDTTVAVYGACGGAELACDDDGGTGLLSKLSVPVTAGTMYWVRVAGWNHQFGAFQLNISAGPTIIPLTNDTCGTAISFNGTLTGVENTATAQNENAEPPSPCNSTTAVGIDNSVWFTFTPGSNGSMSGTIDPAYDGMAVLYTGTCGSLTEVACWDEPEPMDMSAPDVGSSAVTAGTQYFLVVGDWGSADGGGDTTFNVTVPAAAAGGACCSGATCVAAASAAACTGVNTAFAGTGTTCNAFGGNNTTPCCLADFNHVGGVTVQDIFDFLAAYFTSNAQADINGGGVSVQDIFDYLSVYFAGCPA